LWGALVVSTVDNIIKPYVLQGQSKLHPLLALLSILGGVGALGPIGVFVGPIAVAFLQAALTMLQTELDTLSDQTPGEGSNSLAEK
jgi:predicted PurR-regulated permease PerM